MRAAAGLPGCDTELRRLRETHVTLLPSAGQAPNHTASMNPQFSSCLKGPFEQLINDGNKSDLSDFTHC